MTTSSPSKPLGTSKPSVEIQHIFIPGAMLPERKEKIETDEKSKQNVPNSSQSKDDRTDRLIGYGVVPRVPPQNFYGRDYYGYPGYNPYHINGEFAPNCADSYPNRRYSCYGLGRR